MKIRTNDEIRLFEETIANCRSSVWVVMPTGEVFDLKTPKGYHQGMARLIDSCG